MKDLLFQAKLHQAKGKQVSVYYSGGGRVANGQLSHLFTKSHARVSDLRPTLVCSGFVKKTLL